MRRKKIYKALAFCLSTVMLAQPVFATTVQQTAQGSLGSVTEESQILPIPGESGKYILKSNGFYCLNEDGTKEMIVSDNSWKTTTGPLLHDAIFTGEIYDARKDLGHWNRESYDDNIWESALQV